VTDDEHPPREGPPLAAVLRAGAAVHDAGHHHAAHDVFEQRWLALKAETGPVDPADPPVAETPTPAGDVALLQGLIQFTAALYHADEGNDEGARGLADGARGYLDGLAPDYRGLNVGAVRSFLAALATDPTTDERLALTVDGRPPRLAALDPPAALAAAPAVADATGHDAGVVERAVGYAREELPDGGAFLGLVVDYLAGEERALVYDRLRARVERRHARQTDVDGLFDPPGDDGGG
jgi:predicted metal-dependent hydrolase